jgi:hypothetical protein
MVVCAYCNHALTGVPGVGSLRWEGPEAGPDDGRPRVHVVGRTYALHGLVARGEASDVFLARRDARVTEQVIVKVLRAKGDEDLLARAWRVLAALHADDAQGADYFQRLLPQPVAHGRLTGTGLDPRPASVFRWRSGFVHTLDDVARAYPAGVDPRAAGPSGAPHHKVAQLDAARRLHDSSSDEEDISPTQCYGARSRRRRRWHGRQTALLPRRGPPSSAGSSKRRASTRISAVPCASALRAR